MSRRREFSVLISTEGGGSHHMNVMAGDARIACRKACFELRNFIKRLEVVKVRIRAEHKPKEGEAEVLEVEDARQLLARKKTATKKGPK